MKLLNASKLKHYLIYLFLFLFFSSCGNKYENFGNLYVANKDSNDVSIIDGFSNFEVGTITLSYKPNDVVYNPDNKQIYVVLMKKGANLKIFQSEMSSSNFSIHTDLSYPSHIELSPDNNKLFITSNNSSNIAILNTKTNQISQTLELPSGVDAMHINTTTNILYLLHSKNYSISVFDIANSSFLDDIKLPEKIYDFAIDEEFNRLYFITETSVLKLNLKKSTLINKINTGKHSNFKKIIFNNNNKQLYISSSNDKVLIVDTYTEEQIGEIPVGSNPTGISLNKKTNRIYVCNSNSNTISVIYCPDNKVINTFPVGIYPHKISISSN